jgi:hypothetical protein
MRYCVQSSQWENLYHIPKDFSQQKLAVACQAQGHIFVFTHAPKTQELHILQLAVHKDPSELQQW